MNRRDIISFLRRNTSSATLGYLRLNVDEKLSMVVLIGSDVVANLTVSSMVDYDDAFVVSLDIPKEYWALHYIDFDELFPRNWPSTEEQRAGEHKGGERESCFCRMAKAMERATWLHPDFESSHIFTGIFSQDLY